MAQVPGYELPETPPVKRSNSSVIWVVVIVGLAAFCVVALLIGAAVLFPVFNQAKFAAQTTACLSEVKQLNLGLLMYTADNDGRLPNASDWYDRASKMAGASDKLQCPLVAKDDPANVGYAFNRALSDFAEVDIADVRETVMAFESLDLKPNASGGPELIPIPGRHGTGSSFSSTFGFTDGSARRVKTGESPGRWKP